MPMKVNFIYKISRTLLKLYKILFNNNFSFSSTGKLSSVFRCRCFTPVSGQCLLGNSASNLFVYHRPTSFLVAVFFINILSPFDFILQIPCVFFSVNKIEMLHRHKLSVRNLDDGHLIFDSDFHNKK